MPHPAIFPPDEARRRLHARGYSLPYVNHDTGSNDFTDRKSTRLNSSHRH